MTMMNDIFVALSKRKRLTFGIGAVVVVILLSTIYSKAKSRAADHSQNPVFTVTEGPLTISVAEAGTIKPKEQQIIKNGLEGRTTILYLIPEGTVVTNGQLLVELDASQLEDSKIDQEIRVQNAEASYIQSRENLEVVKNQAESDIDKAELTLRFAKEDLAQYKEGQFPNELKEAEARITLAKEEFKRAEEKYKWSQVLNREKYLAESELQADELSMKKAGLDVELTTNNLTLLKEYTYKRKVAQFESDVKQAAMALERVKRKASADVVQAKVNLRAKESEYKQQTDKLKKIKDQIGKARIFAPRNGLVVYATSVKFSWRGNTEPLDEGQEVRERQELIYLPTASTFLAEIKVHESNLDKIRVGLPVRITVDALPGKQFSGRVLTIAPLPDAMSMFMNPDLKLFNTEILIDGGGDVLRTGMSCRAEIIVEHYEKAVYVPVQTVVRVQGVTAAFVRTRRKTEPRPVKIGLDNNRMVRILEGLAPGEEVLLTPPLQAASAVEGTSVSSPTPVSLPSKPAKGESVPPPVKAQPGNGDIKGDAAGGQRETKDGRSDRGSRDGERSSRSRLPEERQKMRERLQKMSPEEREAFRKRMQGRRNRNQE